MTDPEREALVERMAQIVAEEATRKPWGAISHAGQMQWCDRMRTALAEAEPVVREDEREWLAQRHDTAAASSSDPNARSLHKQMAGELRARGAA